MAANGQWSAKCNHCNEVLIETRGTSSGFNKHLERKHETVANSYKKSKGAADCPLYARTELLADRLALNLPNFHLHKIVKVPGEWKGWVTEECQKRGWQHSKSPLVWRELVNRGGKGMLIGGANEFQEYVLGHYGMTSDLMSNDMINIARENLTLKTELDREEKTRIDSTRPVRICITCAATAVAYSVIHALAAGEVLGRETSMALHLYDDASAAGILEGIAMEATDLALPKLAETLVFTDLDQALENCEVVIMLDEVFQDKNETHEAWLRRNHKHFSFYHAALEKLKNPNVKIIISGRGPINFIANMIHRFVPSIDPCNIVALPWLVESRAKAVVAERLGINSALITDLVVWGSVNGSHFLDLSGGRIFEHDGAIWGPRPFSVPLNEMVHDKEEDESWLETKFTILVDERLDSEETKLRHPATMSAGDAIAAFLREWWNGTTTGDIHSLAVASQGWYSVPEGLVFSFPVKFIKPGKYEVLDDFKLTSLMQSKLDDVIEELELEVETIFPNPDRKPRKRHIEFILAEPDQPNQEDQVYRQTGNAEKEEPSDRSGNLSGDDTGGMLQRIVEDAEEEAENDVGGQQIEKEINSNLEMEEPEEDNDKN